MNNDTTSQGKGRGRRRTKPAKPRSTVTRSLADMTGNIIPLYREFRASPERSHFPKGHVADIVLFTGVQIVRSGTEG